MFTFLPTLLAQSMPGLPIDLRSRKAEVAAVTDFPTAAAGILNMILLIGAFIAFGFLVWGGLDWIMSGGESSKIESARKKMTQAIIGLTLLAASAVIFMLVQSFLGLGVLRSDPTPQTITLPNDGSCGARCRPGDGCLSGSCFR